MSVHQIKKVCKAKLIDRIDRKRLLGMAQWNIANKILVNVFVFFISRGNIFLLVFIVSWYQFVYSVIKTVARWRYQGSHILLKIVWTLLSAVYILFGVIKKHLWKWKWLSKISVFVLFILTIFVLEAQISGFLERNTFYKS